MLGIVRYAPTDLEGSLPLPLSNSPPLFDLSHANAGANGARKVLVVR